MKILRARSKSDFARVEELQLKCLPGDQVLDATEGYWWLIWDDTEPIGFAGMQASAQWENTGYMCRAGVLRAYRGKKLQKRLIRVRVNYARRLGWTHLVSDTRDNPPSANSLIAMGFKIYHPRKPWGFKESIHWIKKL